MKKDNILPFKNKRLYVKLEPSTYCNSSCYQCERVDPITGEKWDWLQEKSYDIDSFKKIFSLDVLGRIYEFGMGGVFGDPIMCKDIYEICEYIINNSTAKIHISTNGSIRTEDWWWDLGVLCGDRLSVTFAIDGSTQEMHETYRKGTNLQKILNNMQSLSFTKANVDVMSILFQHSYPYKEDIEKLSRNYGATHIVQKASPRYGDLFRNRFSNDLLPLNEIRGDITEEVQHEFTCPWIKTDRIYVDVNYVMWPCCYSADRMDSTYLNMDRIPLFDVDNFLWKEYKDDSMNVLKHGFLNVLNSPFWENLYSNLGKSPVCVTSCSNKQREIND